MGPRAVHNRVVHDRVIHFNTQLVSHPLIKSKIDRDDRKEKNMERK